MIGIYDSGIGGVTIYQHLKKYIDTGKIVYYADNSNCPLGDKTIEEVKESVANACEFLFENGCSLILLACNTATVAAVRYIQNEWVPENYLGRKVLGIIRPVSEGLIEEGAQKNDNILILSTKLTHDSEFYQEELKEAGFGNIRSLPLKGLAEAIENQDDKQIAKALDGVETQIKDLSKVDYLVLACTHYPLAKKMILAKLHKLGLREDVHVFDQGRHVAEKLMDYLKRHDDVILSDLGGIFFVTGQDGNFEKQLKEIFDIEGYVLEV